ncbi:MAG: ASKHA domain-containing protein [Xanthobacteraceae bacterium]
MSHHPPAAPDQAYALSFPALDRVVTAEPGETIFHCARRHGVRIVGACGGRGACGSCTVAIAEGLVEHVNGRTIGPRRSHGDAPRERWLRSCQIKPRADCTLEIEKRSLAPIVRADVDAAGAETLALDPAVIALDITVPAPSLHDPAADGDRVARALPLPLATIDLAAGRELPALLRKADGPIRVFLRDGEAIAFAPAERPGFGLAIDLGTTNVAGFLVDLATGARVASLGIENPQVFWGADVISRINHAIRDHAAAEELRLAAIEAINAIAHDLCHAVKARASDIVDITVCGNTAMHHLLLGLPVRQLGRAPFVAALREAMDVKARDLDLAVAAGAYVHFAANIGGFVGGDHVTTLLATEPQWADVTVSFVLDIGTNTEISLIHRGKILTASCPSGPALEGAHIACGMRAADGAIERIRIVDGLFEVQVIGGKRAVGLCGSGVLDAVAALLGAGLINESGRLVAHHPTIHAVDGRRAVMLADEVFFAQADLRAVQLAKAAIRTGIDLLLRIAGLDVSAVERIIIAGAFGNYIDVDSAIAVGLLPDLPAERVSQVGNAAGLGVRQMLASRAMRTRARELAARCHYVELGARADFQKTFMHNIGFGKLKAGRRAS